MEVLIAFDGEIQEHMDIIEYFRPLGYVVNRIWLNLIWFINKRMASQGKIAKQGTNGNLKRWDGLKREERQLRILQHVLRRGNFNDH